jgi:PKD repeat protein
MYTAPLAPPLMIGGPATLLEIHATPVGTDFQTAVSQHVEILLVAPPVPKQSETAPIAGVTWAPANPKVGDTVLFDASGSRPGPGRRIVSFSWSFGDNVPNDEHGHDASHVYTAPGSYTLVVGVVDDLGQIGSAFRTITVSP